MYAVKPQTAQRVCTNQIHSGVDSDRSLCSVQPSINVYDCVICIKTTSAAAVTESLRLFKIKR